MYFSSRRYATKGCRVLLYVFVKQHPFFQFLPTWLPESQVELPPDTGKNVGTMLNGICI